MLKSCSEKIKTSVWLTRSVESSSLVLMTKTDTILCHGCSFLTKHTEESNSFLDNTFHLHFFYTTEQKFNDLSLKTCYHI